ncbi:hypothetical protein H8B09_09970 [Paenibacillus sp. PR3]|uniref:Peptidase metallopeptidase domain-containing protein n=1 Tax=Paenibacillus terricola TaxID=2763503 RepID=A0ABR8MUX9_9BACL|nr:hypothetical protein [Paenibacillus terricola]MBD3919081.1 hypothetical protein [Paenibacillus terricola]
MQKKLVSLLFILTMVFSFALNVYASDHEMYYKVNSSGSVSTVPLRWINKNSSTGRLKVIIDPVYLSGNWSTNYDTARSAWHSSAAPVEFTTSSSLTAPNVRLATTTESYWTNRFGPPSLTYEVIGVTDVVDTNGSVITTYDSAAASSKQIKLASIYFNPKPVYMSMSKHDYIVTMTHEFGHVLCLGHSHDPKYNPADPTTDPSIMSYTYMWMEKNYAPQNHEIGEVKRFYGY